MYKSFLAVIAAMVPFILSIPVVANEHPTPTPGADAATGDTPANGQSEHTQAGKAPSGDESTLIAALKQQNDFLRQQIELQRSQIQQQAAQNQATLLQMQAMQKQVQDQTAQQAKDQKNLRKRLFLNSLTHPLF